MIARKEKVKIPKFPVREGSTACLPFERPIVELENMIREMKSKEGVNLEQEIKSAEKKLEVMIEKTFANLTPWQRVQVARHPLRPYTLDYVHYMIEGFVELHGDRYFSDDKAIVGGFGRFNGQGVCVIGHQKGRDTKENLIRSFGSAHPEGYRKAIRLMKLAEKFDLPIISFIDTPGAYPGIGAEERGQAEAIAFNLRAMSEITVPIIVVVIGEGGSGGALGIGIGDKILMLENAYYSVISPEGCAAILWRDSTKSAEAAQALKLTAENLLELGVIDQIVKEPLGGAHRDFEATARELQSAIAEALKSLQVLSKKELPEKRFTKFRAMGVFSE